MCKQFVKHREKSGTSHLFFTTKPQVTMGFRTREHLKTANAQHHFKICEHLQHSGCVNRWHVDEELRNNMHELGKTIEDMQK